MFGMPEKKTNRIISFLKNYTFSDRQSHLSPTEKLWSVVTFTLGTISLFFVIAIAGNPVQKFISPFVASFTSLEPLKETKKGHEVLGFAPYWTINKLDNVDFDTLTTLAYFGAPIDGNGDIVRDDQGYRVFKSEKATALFKKAHAHGTRVVLTLTIMDNDTIETFLASSDARENAINQAITEVKNRGIDGVNVDVEYVGNPGRTYRDNFSSFVATLTEKMHAEIPHSRVTVSVYASAAKDKKMYDVEALGASADGIFMMAYDFAVKGSDVVMPTAPLYGHKEGKYSYDIATAVDDFLKVMPAEKLILGVPYYGYSYLIYGEPQVKATTRPSWSWRGGPMTKTYSLATEEMTEVREGWDEHGQVGWKAYYVADSDAWRMMFLDDARSLRIKYDFAKSKNLLGVGMWALGFDDGKSELWSVLRDEFGTKNLADSRQQLAEINN